MKKVTILAIAAIVSLSAFSQTQQPVAKIPPSDTVTVEIGKAKFVKLGDRVYTVEQLTTGIPLFVDINWIAASFSFIQTSKNGEFTSLDIDKLKVPLIPYIQAIQRAQTGNPK